MTEDDMLEQSKNAELIRFQVFCWQTAADNRIEVVTPNVMASALMASGPNNVTKVLGIIGADVKAISDDMLANLKASLPRRRPKVVDHSIVALSEGGKEINRIAAECCELMSDPAMGTHHVLLAMLKADPTLSRLFGKHGVTFSKFRSAVKESLVVEKPADPVRSQDGQKLEKVADNSSSGGQGDGQKKQATTEKDILTRYCKNLSSMAEQGKLDPVIGRKKEIDRLILTLGRRKKNNAILVGEPGVGKTAIVEGVALRIHSGSVPQGMRKKQVFQLNMTAVVGKTTYRGQFEDRMRAILDVFSSNKDYILFVDEVHTLIGAGSSIGGLDAANIMKPALANGDIRCIGATTEDEYRRFFKKDGALDRRFQRIFVEEPTKDEAKRILFGIKDTMETHHLCTISDEAIDLAVELSSRYVQDRRLPDKAIDCIDEACANAMFASQDGKPVTIVKKDVITAIASQTDMPEEIIGTSDIGKAKRLKEFLASKIVGQDAAIADVSRALLGAYSGVRDPKRPIGCFVFGGPPGSGTAYVAEKMADALFESDSSLVRINLSEFSEKFGHTRLIGSPPGYVGYGDKNLLTDRVARKPYCLILLDGIENASDEVIKLLTQPMTTGIMTDANGKDVSFKNAIIVMTIGFKPGKKNSRMGFSDHPKDAKSDALEEECRKRFDDDFVSRIDEFVAFSELSEADLVKLAGMRLKELASRLKDIGVELSWGDGVCEAIVGMSGGKENGARGVDKTVRKDIESMISGSLSDGKVACLLLSIGKDGAVFCSPCHNKVVAETV